MKDEDEHALQGVEDGEEVSHDDGALIDVHEAESPGQAQKTQQGYGPDHPGPNMRGINTFSYHIIWQHHALMSNIKCNVYNVGFV